VGDKVLDSKITHRSLGAIHSKANQLGLTKEPTGRKISMPDDKKKQGSVPDVLSIDTDSLIENLGSNGDHKNKHYKSFHKIFHRKMLENHGIDLSQIGKPLGKGTAGIAYEYKNNVLKITCDMTEAFSSAAIKNKTLPGVVDIYSVVLLAGSDQKNYRLDNHGVFKITPVLKFRLAFILQEKLRPLPLGTKEKLQKRLKKFSKHMNDKLAFFIRDYFRKRISRKSLEKIFTKLWGKRELYAGFWNSINALTKHGVVFYDYHMGNLMVDSSGRVTLIDLGYSYTENRKGADVMSLEYLLREIKLLRR